MSAGVHLQANPTAVDPSDVEDFVNAHLKGKGQLDRPLSQAVYAALFRHSHGDRPLLLALGGLTVFLARLESANHVESRHVDAAALSRSEVELTGGVTSIVMADAGAKLVASKFGGATRLHGRLYAGVAAVMVACLVIGLSYALSLSRFREPALGEPFQGVDVTAMAPDPPALAVAGPPPKVSSTNDTEPAVASIQNPADTPPDQRTSPIAHGAAVATTGDSRHAPPPLSHVLVTFAPGDVAARERAMRLVRYLRDDGYDVDMGPLVEGGRRAGHVEYFFGADAAAAAELAAFLGGRFGGAMLAPSRPDQRRPGTIEIAMPPGKAVPSLKAAALTLQSFESLQVGRN